MLGFSGSLSIVGCIGDRTTATDSEPPMKTLTLATATTVHDSGLLDELTPGFEDLFGVTLKAVVQGTGAALRTARDGDCDIVLVHARPLENEFIHAGYGINRRRLMVNDFMIIGPPDDPAGVAGRSPSAAFRAIAETETLFLSRGDRSGTHIRERRLWREAGVVPSGEWYRETGQGMGSTLVTAEQIGAYTLIDRGTFLSVSTDGTLVQHIARGIEGPPPLLRNEYAVIPVNPARNEGAYALAMAFVGSLTGPGQAAIEEFHVNGERVFRPTAMSLDPDFEQYVPTDWPEWNT